MLNSAEVSNLIDALTTIANDSRDDVTARKLHRLAASYRRVMECGAADTGVVLGQHTRRVKPNTAE